MAVLRKTIRPEADSRCNPTIRAIWRRATWDSYLGGKPEWATVLNIDALANAENMSWSWAGADCLEPGYRLCRGDGEADASSHASHGLQAGDDPQREVSLIDQRADRRGDRAGGAAGDLVYIR